MSKIQIMGILNVTPDSFYDGMGNSYMNKTEEFNRVLSQDMSKADIIDVGAVSSRPGSSRITIAEEIKRLSIIKNNISSLNKITFSVDTYKYDVAKYALDSGYSMINDIYAGRYDDRIFELSSDRNVPIVLMHMKGDPSNMQENTNYNSIIDDIMFFFEQRIDIALKRGVDRENIIIDPGIGFGKTVFDNDKIIRCLSRFKIFDIPVLIGLSRKSFLSIDNDKPINRLESSLSVASIAINNGADIIRVHDIEKSISVFSIIDRLINKNKEKWNF